MERKLFRRVEELFHAAVALTPEARAAFLVQACGADDGLRRQLELLLSKDKQSSSLLTSPVLAELTAIMVARGSLIGRQFGSYRIESLLGAGGMGEVYRAHDTKLDRDVAIKTLPDEFARDAERLARFRQEARTVAALNHPNIAAIYGLEVSGDLDCLVMELVDGEMLHGPLPISIALDRACQLAHALEAAHGQGIIHRDLKPANVKVTPHGRVKVLDFGLAKAIWRTDGNPDFFPDARRLKNATVAGHIVGTPGYMSPEQARGEDVDQRTDIWGFGCLLYEMLTDKRAAAGDDAREIDHATAETGLDRSALPSKTPPKIRKLVRQCLEHDADHRLAHIADARRVLEEVQHRRSKWLLAAGGAASFATFVIVLVTQLLGPARPRDRSDWVQLTRFPDPVSQPALTRDGRMLAFVRGPRTTYGVGQIYIKHLPDGDTVQLTHDELRKADPVFSPDGTRIAYTVVDPEFHWDTWVVPVTGGEPRLWLRNASGLSWVSFGQLLFSSIKVNFPMGIVSAPDDRSSERDVYFPWNARGMATNSQASPDGKWALVAEMSAYGNWDQCRVVPLDGSSKGQQVGPPAAPCSFGAWSPNGKWMYLTSKAGGLYHVWRQRFPDGHLEQLTSGVTEEEGIAVTPDGRSLVTAVAVESSTLWIHDAHEERQISILEGNAADPKFAPDGKRLYYRIVKAVQIVGTKKDPGELWSTDLASGRAEHVAPGLLPLEYDLSRDGRWVVMNVSDNRGKPRLWVAPVDRSSSPRQIGAVEGQNPTFSPRGEVMYRHLEGAASFVYRVQANGTGLRKAVEQPVFYAGPVTPDGGWISVWKPLSGKTVAATQLLSLHGGSSIVVGANTVLQWSSTGTCLWISAGPVPDGRTYVIPLRPGVMLPQIPQGGFHSEQEIAALPGARRLDVEGAPGPSAEVYAFERHTIQRNLYRFPIP